MRLASLALLSLLVAPAADACSAQDTCAAVASTFSGHVDQSGFRYLSWAEQAHSSAVSTIELSYFPAGQPGPAVTIQVTNVTFAGVGCSNDTGSKKHHPGSGSYTYRVKVVDTSSQTVCDHDVTP